VTVFGILFGAIGRGGDPNLIVRAIDYRGFTCGVDEAVKDLKYGAWPDLAEYRFKVCLDSCDQTKTDSRFLANYESTQFVFFCIPTDSSANFLDTDFQNTSDDASRVMGDLWTAWPIILASAFIGLLLAFVYTWLLRYIAGPLVWLSFIMVIAGGFMVGYGAIKVSREQNNTQVNDRVSAIRAFGIIIVVFTTLFVLFLFCIRNRIKIAIAVVGEASRALTDLWTIVLFPVIPFVFAVAYMVFFISVMLYIFSVGSFDKDDTPSALISKGFPNTYRHFSWNDGMKGSAAVNFFHLLWNVNVLVYFTFMVVAGAVADWYFTPYNANGEKPVGDQPTDLGRHPTYRSCLRVLRFHLGTVAFGALVIAVIQFIRACIRYVEEKTRVAQGGTMNPCQKCLFCFLNCFSWCVEACMDKVNKNALIWSSIWGDSFATSCCNSFGLIWRNILRAAAINLVGAYVVVVGKVMVALVTTGICALIFWGADKFFHELSSPVMPLVLIFVLSYLVSSLFMVAVETTIDTTFFCFLVDEEYNNGAILASRELSNVVENFSDQSKRQGLREQAIVDNRHIRIHGSDPPHSDVSYAPSSAHA